MNDHDQQRRRFLHVLGTLPVAYGAYSGNLAAQELPPTRACSDGDEPTARQMEGPFFKPRSPQRVSLLETGVTGTKIAISGVVLSTRCKPLAGALLDFWQCDGEGDYDNRGFRLRGHQFTDNDGRYRLETVMPGVYPGRTRHIHVKVQAPNGPILTTQVYFPGEPANSDDFLFQPSLLVAMKETGAARIGRFDFVVKAA